MSLKLFIPGILFLGFAGGAVVVYYLPLHMDKTAEAEETPKEIEEPAVAVKGKEESKEDKGKVIIDGQD